MGNVSRREFLVTAAATVAIISLPILQAEADTPATAPSGGTFDVGALSSFSKDAINDKWTKTKKFFVIRQDGKLYASSAICTHRGVLLISRGQDMYCTKHKSDFSIEGTVISGPAKKSLPRYAISIDAQKHVIVDTSQSFSEKHWDDPASFISLQG